VSNNNKLPDGWGDPTKATNFAETKTDTDTPPGWGNASEPKSDTIESESYDVTSGESQERTTLVLPSMPNLPTISTIKKGSVVKIIVIVAVVAVLVVGGVFGVMYLVGEDNGNGDKTPTESDDIQTSSTTAEPVQEEQWKVAAEDFLSQFPTVILLGEDIPVTVEEAGNDDGYHEADMCLEEGQYLQPRQFLTVDKNGKPTISTEIPDVYYLEGIGYYDKNGNEIADAIWNNNEAEETEYHIGVSAVNILFWDLDNDGIPEIEIYFYPHWVHSLGGGWGSYELYKYVNGSYKMVDNWDSPKQEDIANGFSYYLDDNDKVISCTTLGYRGQEGIRFDYVSFNDNGTAIFEIIASCTYNHTEDEVLVVWKNHITRENNIPDSSDYYYDWNNPDATLRIPGTDNLLTPIEPMETLKEEIINQINKRK